MQCLTISCAIAAANVLAVSATTATPPAFAVTRLHNGSVSVKINRKTSLAEVNRKLAAMGIKVRQGRMDRQAGGNRRLRSPAAGVCVGDDGIGVRPQGLARAGPPVPEKAQSQRS